LKISIAFRGVICWKRFRGRQSMLIVLRTVERNLGVWRKGDLNGRGVAQSQGDTLRGTWGLAARSKAQASLLAYGKNETRARRKRTPKDLAFCRFD
jgi:hypothetical protein